jgi:hypothetical protein
LWLKKCKNIDLIIDLQLWILVNYNDVVICLELLAIYPTN